MKSWSDIVVPSAASFTALRPCHRRPVPYRALPDYAETMETMTVPEALAELGALEDPKARAVNERHGDAHGVNLSRMRALAKRIGMSTPFARELWASDDVAGQLLGLLIA